MDRPFMAAMLFLIALGTMLNACDPQRVEIIVHQTKCPAPLKGPEHERE